MEVIHNQLDNTFKEDRCRIARGSRAELLSGMRKLALNLFNPLRKRFGKETLPSLMDLFSSNDSFALAVLDRPPDMIVDPASWRKKMGEVTWSESFPEPTALTMAA